MATITKRQRTVVDGYTIELNDREMGALNLALGAFTTGRRNNTTLKKLWRSVEGAVGNYKVGGKIHSDFGVTVDVDIADRIDSFLDTVYGVDEDNG